MGGMRSALTRMVSIRGVPRRVVALTAAASLAGLGLTLVQGWPIWAVGAAVVAPWIPVLVLETAWTHRHYGWLALFYLLVVTQGGHVVEHLVQMVQLHVLGLPAPHARGIFGALDVEWVHLAWNTWVLVAVAMLTGRFRSNPWLWAALLLAGWHQAEHVYIIATYLSTGVAGTPGLLAEGGAIAGGLGIRRPDLHFLYNAVETAPLVVGFVYQLRRSHDEWLTRLFPAAPERDLVRTSERARTVHVPALTEVIREGDLARAVYVVVRGELEVHDNDEGAVAVLGPGDVFGDTGVAGYEPHPATVRARTPAELLQLDAGSYRELVKG